MTTQLLNPVAVIAFARKHYADRRALLVLGLLTFVVSPMWADDVAVSQSAFETNPDGWINIMPPTDLKGWSRVPVPPGGKLGRAQWHVDADKGLLVCDGDGGHDMLLTKKEYGNATFHFEFRYTKVEGKTGYNSGAYVRNSKDGVVWHQAQFGDSNGGFLFGVTPSVGGKGKFFILQDQVTSNRVKPAGEWNTLEITAKGKTLTLWVNGAVTCRFDGCGLKSGHVGLEGEGYRIEFRNLQVKLLRSE
jgi:3-keto-disaccharide hydrolase